MMDMFQYRANVVSVENHSWGNVDEYKLDVTQSMATLQSRSNVVSFQSHSWGTPDQTQLAPRPLESVGISNAIAFGRGGNGVVMVRSAGNNREHDYLNQPLIGN